MTAYDRNTIRNMFEDMHIMTARTEEYLRKRLKPEEQHFIEEYHREHLRDIRRRIRAWNDAHTDPLRDSLRTGSRRRISNGDDIGDAYTEFWIVPDTNLSDDAIHEIVTDEIVDFFSPYDCTGKLYTSHISANRTPIGLAVVNVLRCDL